MFHMISCFNFKPDEDIKSFRSAYTFLVDEMKRIDLKLADPDSTSKSAAVIARGQLVDCFDPLPRLCSSETCNTGARPKYQLDIHKTIGILK